MSGRLRKIADLATEARAATERPACERLLLDAAAQAAGFHDWEEILKEFPAVASRELLSSLVARAIEAAQRRQEIWGFRNAAEIQARDLQDTGGARATLRAGEEMLQRRGSEVLGYEYGVLADGIRVASGDAGEVRRVLSVGWELAWGAKDVENLGRVANYWQKLLGRDEAVARLARVEEAARGWGDLGGVIYWWHALGDPAAANRVRSELVDGSARFDEVLDLVRYWRLYEKESPGIEAAIARAESLAAAAVEWFELAALVRREDGGDAIARRALDKAAELAVDVPLRAQIANSYVEWFDDAAAADRVGPRGLLPDELHEKQATLDGWDGSAAALFDWLRARVTREQLEAIAEADYGDDRERHFAALDEICRSGRIPLSLAWHPGEVVALTRWSSEPPVDHLARALCCVLLLLAAPDDDPFNTGPILVESCLALGEEAATAGERLLARCWEICDHQGGASIVFLWLLSLLRGARAPDDPRLAILAETIAASDEAGSLREWMAGSLRADLWNQLVGEIGPKLPRVAASTGEVGPLDG